MSKKSDANRAKKRARRKQRANRKVHPRTEHYGTPSSEEWDVQRVEELIANPLYAGIGPFPRLISDTAYVKAASKMIREIGPERYLHLTLKLLREQFGRTDSDSRISDHNFEQFTKAMEEVKNDSH